MDAHSMPIFHRWTINFASAMIILVFAVAEEMRLNCLIFFIIWSDWHSPTRIKLPVITYVLFNQLIHKIRPRIYHCALEASIGNHEYIDMISMIKWQTVTKVCLGKPLSYFLIQDMQVIYNWLWRNKIFIINIWDPFYWHGFRTFRSNHTLGFMWEVINHQFLNWVLG